MVVYRSLYICPHRYLHQSPCADAVLSRHQVLAGRCPWTATMMPQSPTRLLLTTLWYCCMNSCMRAFACHHTHACTSLPVLVFYNQLNPLQAHVCVQHISIDLHAHSSRLCTQAFTHVCACVCMRVHVHEAPRQRGRFGKRCVAHLTSQNRGAGTSIWSQRSRKVRG